MNHWKKFSCMGLMEKDVISATIIAIVLVALLTSCASERSMTDHTIEDDGTVNVPVKVEIDLDQEKFAFVCSASFQVEKNEETGNYEILDIQASDFVTAKAKPQYVFLPTEELKITKQEDGSYMAQQSMQMYKSNQEAAEVFFTVQYTFDAETGKITSTVLPVEVQDEMDTERRTLT